LDNPKCNDYKPRDKTAKPNCPNCYQWGGVQCMDHLILIKRNMTLEKFENIDRMMRSNKGVYLG